MKETPEQATKRILETEPSDTEEQRIALAKRIDDEIAKIAVENSGEIC